MNHPLHNQQQQQYHPQQAQQIMMQGSPQIGSSPSMDANYNMQMQQGGQQMQQYPQNYQQTGNSSPMQQQIMQPQHEQQYYQHQPYHQGHHHSHQSMPHPPSNPAMNNGPKAKCDQVIYEAIAKSCEIAVRGRCTDLIDDSMTGSGDGRRGFLNYGGRNNNPSASNNNSGSTSSRFNIEVDEVPNVRSVVHSWKMAVHVPLRLDIYYEHDGCYDDEQNEICEGEGQGGVLSSRSASCWSDGASITSPRLHHPHPRRGITLHTPLRPPRKS